MSEINKADVSAIIPVYNGERFLRKAVESIINQTLLPKEIVIVDDGSTDGSLHILEDIETPVPIIKISQQNAGQASARNRGVQLSTGQFIAFLDQDDYWHPRHIELLIKPLLEDPIIGWTYSNIDEIEERGKLIVQGVMNYLSHTHPKTQLHICLSEDMYILPSASIIRKEAFNQIDGFDERLCGYEDDDLFLRLFRAGWHNRYINESLSVWRIHSSSTLFSKKTMNSRRIYAEKLMAEYPDKPEMNQFFTKNHIAPRFFKMNKNEYWRGIRKRKYDLCRESLKDMKKFAMYFNNGLPMRLKLFIFTFPRLVRIILKIFNIQK